MRILAIETSGATFSLAIAEDGVLLSELYWHAGLSHSERLVPSIQRLMDEAGWSFDSLGRIAVSTGPGSFTGIRVGLTCARTMAQGLKVPLVGMNTLELLAAAVPQGNYRVLPLLDALRNELYVPSNGKEAVEIKPVDKVLRELNKRKTPTLVVGNAVFSLGREIEKTLKGKVILAPHYLNYPRAGVLALAAEKAKAKKYSLVRPLYIRRSWAEEKR